MLVHFRFVLSDKAVQWMRFACCSSRSSECKKVRCLWRCHCLLIYPHSSHGRLEPFLLCSRASSWTWHMWASPDYCSNKATACLYRLASNRPSQVVSKSYAEAVSCILSQTPICPISLPTVWRMSKWGILHSLILLHSAVTLMNFPGIRAMRPRFCW